MKWKPTEKCKQEIDMYTKISYNEQHKASGHPTAILKFYAGNPAYFTGGEGKCN